MIFSIIVPVYNVENYLKECLDSILRQTDENCELILINDGSTDSSGLICDQYAVMYPIVKVFHQNNCGVSSARNTGIDLASGEYIGFVDSDDILSPDCIPNIINWIKTEDTDLCFMDAVKFFPNGHREALGDCIQKRKIKGASQNEVLKYLSKRPKFPGSACTKIFKSSFLKTYNIRFPSHTMRAEDLGFIRDCLYHAKSFDVLDFPYYEYRQLREGSTTTTAGMKSFVGILRFVEDSIKMLTDNQKAKDKKCYYLMSSVAYEYSILLMLYATLSIADKKSMISFLNKYKWVLAFAQTPKTVTVAFSAAVIGLKKTANLLKNYYKLRTKQKVAR